MGAPDVARSLLKRAESLQPAACGDDLAFLAGLHVARAFLQLTTGELASALVSLSEGRAMADRIEHAMLQASCRLLFLAAYADVGSSDRAEASARELLALCEPNGLRFFSDRSAAFLAVAKMNAGDNQAAIALLRPLINRPDRQVAITARARLAHALVAAGDLESAVREASGALEGGASFPPKQRSALGALGLVALRRGQFADAVGLANHGLRLEPSGSWLRDGSILRLVRAEALHGLGEIEDAREAIREARDQVLSVAATLEDLEMRVSYVTNIAPNARTLALAREWLGEDPP
jgi:tetratricopeptide (TPR) repeat protein